MQSSILFLILLAAAICLALMAAGCKKCICRRCQKRNLSGARYCAQCGARLRVP
jgi:hypothetical protein